MQLFALKEKEVVFAGEAKRGELFFCLECGGKVRIRKGFFKRAHFYHIKENVLCKQSGKGKLHLYLQLYLTSLLNGEGVMEKHFPSIKRIADVAWHNRKIIFEIQCSPIDFEEVKKREEDYRSIGYTVVWLLHDRLFNKWRICGGEERMRQLPSLFFAVTKNKKIFFYDQFEFVSDGIRKFKGKSCQANPLKLFIMQPLPFLQKDQLPTQIWKRLLSHPIYFFGDLVDLTLKEPKGLFLKQMINIEKNQSETIRHKSLSYFLKNYYYKILSNLLST